MDSQLQILMQAAQNLLREINVSTDCMSNQIKRESIDDHIDRLEAAIKAVGEPTKFIFRSDCKDLSEVDRAALMKFLDQPGQIIQESMQAFGLRPEVLAFALLMEQRLREKDADKGQRWKSKSKDNLIVDATVKLRMLETSIQRELPHEVHHAVDLANHCMMIADVAGALALNSGEVAE